MSWREMRVVFGWFEEVPVLENGRGGVLVSLRELERKVRA